ncbi:MAG: PH domain-containing protein [Rothia sp. (in: high G+C Gram-positive bacteria)]|nr:PH domain-containing protein [Rothia sp. (in: high G+C Gram-positive bacteria)]
MNLRGPLLDGEYLILATRAHRARLLGPLALLLGAVIFWSFSSSVIPSLPFLGYLALGLALYLLYRALKGALAWWLTVYQISNYRLLIRQGWRSQSDLSFPLSQIEGVEVGQRLWMGLADAAALQVQARGQAETLEALPDPDRWSLRIKEAQLAYFGAISEEKLVN